MPATGNPNVHGILPGGWYMLPTEGAVSTMNLVPNRTYAIPLWPHRVCTLTGVAVEITTLAAGNLRAGLYVDSGLYSPGRLIADFGRISTNLTGVRSWAVNQDLRCNLYWVVVSLQGLLAVGVRTRSTAAPFVYRTSPSLSSNDNSHYIDGMVAEYPGVSPNTDGSTQGPSVAVQLV